MAQQKSPKTKVTDAQMRTFLKMYQMEHLVVRDKYTTFKSIQKPKSSYSQQRQNPSKIANNSQAKK